MNFSVQLYDPIAEALELFTRFNRETDAERELSEDELTRLIVHRVKTHYS